MKKKQDTKWYLFEDALFSGRKTGDRSKRHAVSRVENIIFIELPGPFKLVGCEQDHGKTIRLTFATKDAKP